MRIAIATPLFPPDTGPTAAYAKELARRLGEHHEVRVSTYGHLPEQVPNVSISTTEKRAPLPLRLLRYAGALYRVGGWADVTYVLNGPSVELPVGLVYRMLGRPYLVGVADRGAHRRATHSALFRRIEHFCFARAHTLIEEFPPKAPEINPLDPYPTEALASHGEAWNSHLALLESAFRHAHTT